MRYACVRSFGALAMFCLLSASAHAAGGATPHRSGEHFVYSDGTRVRATDPGGRTGVVQNNGSIRFTDGTTVSHDSSSGETRVTHPDGRVDVSNSHTPRREGDTFVYSDGARVRATDPSGRAGTVKPDGSISYSDGTVVSHDVATGDTKFMHPGGRVEVIGGNTPHRGADGNFVYSDGAQIRGTDPSGNPGKINPDGSISYSDGTTATHDTRTGDTKFVGPDGAVRLLNPATGTDKTSPGSRQNGGAARPAQASPGASKTSTVNHRNDSNSKEKKDAKPEKQAEKVDKPAPEKAEKPGKGRMVLGDGTGSPAPRLVVGGLTTNPAPDQAPGGPGQPKLKSPGSAMIGPGGRPNGNAGPRGTFFSLPAGSLVVNPNPVGTGRGGGVPKPLDAAGGRR